MKFKMIIIIGELLSLLAAICLAYSTFGKKKDKIIFWQIIDSLFNAFSNLFLFSYSGMITNLLTFFRNIMIYKNKFNKKIMILFIVSTLIIGTYFNNKGIWGLLPIFATIEYTICVYKFSSAQKIRYALIINLILWMIYDYYIKAYPMFIMDIIICLVSIINIFRLGNVAVRKSEKE